MPLTPDAPPVQGTEPGDPVWLLVTAEVAAAHGYPETLVGQWVIDGRVPEPEPPADDSAP
jgi:hypothetical protein